MMYSEKLKDPRWQKKRLEILNRDEFTCTVCGDKESTLNVHHEFYEKGLEPWEADEYNLTTLCEDCHEVNHLGLTDLEKHLLMCLRNRDKGNMSMIKLSNQVVRRFKEK